MATFWLIFVKCAEIIQKHKLSRLCNSSDFYSRGAGIGDTRDAQTLRGIIITDYGGRVTDRVHFLLSSVTPSVASTTWNGFRAVNCIYTYISIHTIAPEILKGRAHETLLLSFEATFSKISLRHTLTYWLIGSSKIHWKTEEVLSYTRHRTGTMISDKTTMKSENS